MSDLLNWSWDLDGWIVLTGTLCAVASALVGNFLVLRRMSMLGDAISHAVLPGLAAAFFITGSRSSLPMFIGAVIVGVLTAMFTEWIRGFGDVDEGASMGVVFTSLFALGLIMIVRAADHVDLDPGCVLYGAIELTPLDTIALFGWSIPRATLTLAAVAILNAVFVLALFKELKIASFDPALATTVGLNAKLIHYLLMILVAITAVASFEAVGSILVVAMMVVPPAAAYLLTDRLATMIGLSVFLAVISSVGGHIGAITIPTYFGYQSTTTAGMMAVAAGALLLMVVLLSPRHGVLVRSIRRHLLGWRILNDDVIAVLYRVEERGDSTLADLDHLDDILLARRRAVWLALWWLGRKQWVQKVNDRYELTDLGREQARRLVRSHRLWEQYLESHVGIDPERLHDKAEQLEHFTDRQMRDRLEVATDAPAVDPHGTPIPSERVGSNDTNRPDQAKDDQSSQG